jgi:hypothetical protein
MGVRGLASSAVRGTRTLAFLSIAAHQMIFEFILCLFENCKPTE